MYCILSLPKTGSTTLMAQLIASLGHDSPLEEPFNPKYRLTVDQEDAKYEKLCNTTPLPVIKVQPIFSERMSKRIIEDRIFKTICIIPTDEKKWMKKFFIMSRLRTVNTTHDRNKQLTPYVGMLDVDFTSMQKIHTMYQNHLTIIADYYVHSDEIYDVNHPLHTRLGVSYRGDGYLYVAPALTDDVMFRDLDDFEMKWEQLHETSLVQPY